MTIDRNIRRGGLLLAAALALAAAAPLAAQAGPLLSGYGGPGQGNQAILGSTLIGGPGGGSSQGPGASTAEASATTGEVPAQTRATGAPRHRARQLARAGLQGATSAGALTARSYPAVEMTSGTSDTLGLSGTDVLYIILAAVALAFTGVFTKIIAGAGTAKGH